VTESQGNVVIMLLGTLVLVVSVLGLVYMSRK
jgi:hypothetical protein